MRTDEDTFELVRPAEFATDYEWACSVTEDKWALKERLEEASDALRITWANVNAWRDFEETFASERKS